jgi:two-component system, NtrC family, sensor kinase
VRRRDNGQRNENVDNRKELIEQLTGVDSSKLNYYVELKKRNEEVLKQNSRLGILHQLTRDINIDMSIEDITERTFAKLPQTLPCDFLGLVTVHGPELKLKAVMPRDFCRIENFPAHSPSLNVVRDKRAGIFNLSPEELSHVRITPPHPGPLRALAVAPMFQRDEVIGALIIGSITDSAYSGADLGFVQHLADQLSISIRNASLYKQVSQAKKEWEETFKAVTDPIFLVDTDFNLLLHNDRLPPELSCFWDKASSDKCYDRLKGRKTPCRTCPLDEIRRTGKEVFNRLQTDSGKVFDLSSYPVFNEERDLVAVTHIVKDVTEKIKMEAQLVHSAKLVALGEMAAGVAHELNSPMTVIIGTAQMLMRSHIDDPDDAEQLKDIINCGLRCKRIIQNLLTFSRQDQAPVSDLDLNAEVEGILGLIKYQIDRSQIRIVKKFAPKLSRVTGNGHQLQQVIINFLVNARDALAESDRRDKVIEVASEERRDGSKRWVRISVRDNGIGIRPENLPKIFTPFYTSKEAMRGTGLGLSVSLGIAQSHNGTIEVESRAGKGSSFTLVLPAED